MIFNSCSIRTQNTGPIAEVKHPRKRSQDSQNDFRTTQRIKEGAAKATKNRFVKIPSYPWVSVRLDLR